MTPSGPRTPLIIISSPRIPQESWAPTFAPQEGGEGVGMQGLVEQRTGGGVSLLADALDLLGVKPPQG